MPDQLHAHVVIVDRIAAAAPEYCVHGETWCVRCHRAVWLGSATITAVESGALPLCLDCAPDVLPPGQTVKARLTDHRRRP